MEWFDLPTEERINKIYAQYTIEQFWNWWSGKEYKVMEIRIKDIELIKQIATQLNLPWSASGVYVKNYIELKQVIKTAREKAVMWYSIQSRKRNTTKFGAKGFSGMDSNVLQIEHLFIDIDRITKIGPATNKDLENSNYLADKILEQLGKVGWNKNYCKICSGNGVQLLIKLDVPIRLPPVEFKAIKEKSRKTGQDVTTYIYTENEEFQEVKLILYKGVGEELLQFSRKKEFIERGVTVDKNTFKLSVVGSLPFTKNYKYESFTWRGIVELKDGLNDGLTDYIMSKKVSTQHPRVFTARQVTQKNKITIDNLYEHKLVRFMLDEDLPYGEINNKLWFSLKILLRDSKFPFDSDQFRELLNKLEIKVKGKLTTNIPDSKYRFEEGTVNSYCINNCIPPLYPMWPNSTKPVNEVLKEHIFKDGTIEGLKEIKLNEGITIMEDLIEFKKDFDSKVKENKIIPYTYFSEFLKGVINKYGSEKAQYYYTYLIKEYMLWE